MGKICFKALVFGCLFVVSFSLRAQVHIEADERIELELQNHLHAKDSFSNKGYRVQVYFGNDKSQAEKAKARVMNACSDLKDVVYIVYQSPNYKVRAGNFEREVDAQRTLKVLFAEFPNVFVVRDDIELLPRMHGCE